MEQLKKCPFCGGEAKLYGYTAFWVCCENEECNVDSDVYESREKAITTWNTRKPIERILERLEELRMAEYDDSDEEPVYTDAEDIFDDGVSNGKFRAYHKAIEIIKEEIG